MSEFELTIRVETEDIVEAAHVANAMAGDWHLTSFKPEVVAVRAATTPVESPVEPKSTSS